MKVILYNAISIDGFIALPDGNSDWISDIDFPYLQQAIKESGCIVVGGKTFRQFEGELFPFKDVLNIVMTRTQTKSDKYSNVIYTQASPKEIAEMAEKKGYQSILLVGGGEMSGTFLNEDLIDEIIVDIQPVMIGSGIKMCNAKPELKHFDKTSIKELENGLVTIRYSRKRN